MKIYKSKKYRNKNSIEFNEMYKKLMESKNLEIKIFDCNNDRCGSKNNITKYIIYYDRNLEYYFVYREYKNKNKLLKLSSFFNFYV